MGYQLYAEFRPEVKGWGEKGKLELAKVLGLRKGHGDEAQIKAENGGGLADAVKSEESDAVAGQENVTPSSPGPKFQVALQRRSADGSPLSKSVEVEELHTSGDLQDDYGELSDSDLVEL